MKVKKIPMCYTEPLNPGVMAVVTLTFQDLNLSITAILTTPVAFKFVMITIYQLFLVVACMQTVTSA